MPVTTVLRGFKIHYSILDDFLWANGLDGTYGYPPVENDYDQIAALLSTKMGGGTNSARVIIPYRESYDQSTFAYVAYRWVHVFAQRELNLETELPEEVPGPFEDLRKEMIEFGEEGKSRRSDDETGRIGLYVVFTGNRSWYPDNLSQLEEGPVVCDQCDQSFESFALRQLHRREAHESTDGISLLPQV